MKREGLNNPFILPVLHMLLEACVSVKSLAFIYGERRLSLCVCVCVCVCLCVCVHTCMCAYMRE